MERQVARLEQVFVEEEDLEKLEIRDITPENARKYMCKLRRQAIEPEKGDTLHRARTMGGGRGDSGGSGREAPRKTCRRGLSWNLR